MLTASRTIAVSEAGLALRQERLRFLAAIALFHQHLHFAFRRVQLHLAGSRQADALFKKLEGLFEGQIALF